LAVPEALIENIVSAIRTHRYRKGLKPETLEAKIIFDADKLDSIGAVGMARSFYFAGKIGAELYTGREEELAKENDHNKYSYTIEDTGILEYEVKLKHLAERMLTGTGKELAKRRHDFMVGYVKEFRDEINGNV
jgi:uncharacterized protein